MNDISPKEFYTTRINILDRELIQLDEWMKSLALLRVSIFFIGSIVGCFNYYENWFSIWWMLAPGFLFMFLVITHNWVKIKKHINQLQMDFFTKGINRIDNNWQKDQIDHNLQPIKNHLFAHDLDLFGKDSLFNLLCTAVTQSGKEQLQKWLYQSAPKELIEKRQGATQELTDELDFRLNLNLESVKLEDKVNSKRLIEWAQSSSSFTKSELVKFQLITWILTSSMALSLIHWLYLEQPPIAFFCVLALEIIFYKVINKKLSPLFASMNAPNRELNFISFLLKKIEEKSFNSTFLKDLQKSLLDGSKVASKQINQFDKYIQRLDMRRNQVFAALSYLLMWSVHFGLKIERWKSEHEQSIPTWLETIGQFEAINSIANYAFEHPEDTYPTIKEGPAFIEGEKLGHPLMSDCIRNSIKLNQDCNLWIISGSNMCGKSTFLRIVGINIVMANIGAPVRAKSLVLSNLTLGSSINVQDSLEKGHSKFYAEILQVKRIVEAASSDSQIIFLMDELLHGTNSHDRLIGAKSIITHILNNRGIGLITTHDLTVTRAIEELKLSAKNMHFQDQFEGENLLFDYKIHPGVVQKSNAIELMRSIGIKV